MAAGPWGVRIRGAACEARRRFPGTCRDNAIPPLPYSDEARCAWFNDEADRLRSSGLSGGQAVAAAGALRQKAAESYCLPGGQGLPTYPSMHHVEGDIFRLKDGEECRWAKVQFLQIASMPHNARTLLDAGNHRQRVREAGCYRY